MSIRSFCEHLSAISPSLLQSLADSAIKGAIILAIVFLLTGAIRRASAAARHLVWFLGTVFLLILPILSTTLPGWHILPPWSSHPSSPQPAQVSVRLPMPAPVEIPPQNNVRSQPDTHLIPNYTPLPPIMIKPPVVRPSASVVVPQNQPSPLTIQAWIVLAWAVIAATYLGYALLGCASLWLLNRRCRKITSGQWLELLADARNLIGFHRPVDLMSCSRRSMPMTWGLWRARILVPDETSNWTDSQRRAVLLHELAHARRFDCLTQLISHVACSLYWFNPLIWLAWNQMQTERERACDDIVLSTGTMASTYAEQLLQIATEMSPVRFSAAAIAMARPSKLEDRLLAILDVKRNRRALTRTIASLALLMVIFLAIPLSMIRADDGKQNADLTASSKPTTQAKEPVVSTAEKLIDQMAGGQYSDVVEHFDSEMTKLASKGSIAEVWRLLKQAGGKYQGRGACRTGREKNYDVVYVPLRWEHNAVEMKFVFDADGQVAGMWTVAPPATQPATQPSTVDEASPGNRKPGQADVDASHSATTKSVAASVDRELIYRKVAAIDRTMAIRLNQRNSDSTTLQNMVSRGLGPKHPDRIAAEEQLEISNDLVRNYADRFLAGNPNFLSNQTDSASTQPAGASAAPIVRHFVQIVIAPDDAMTFDGADTDWDKLPALLEKVPDREHTALCLGESSDDVTIGQYHDAMAQAAKFVKRFGFESLSDNGRRALHGNGPGDKDLAKMSEKVRSAIDIISTGTDGDPKVAKALESLKDVDVSVVIAETSRGLTSDDDNTRRAAIYILWRGNLERIDPAPLIQACKHKEDLTRGMAALALGENHAGAGEQTLIDMATKDPSHYARRCAAYALGLLGDPAVLPTLQKVKGDSDPAVAYNAKAAIKMLSGKVVTRPTTKHE